MTSCLSIVVVLALATTAIATELECITGASYLYAGTRSTTASGFTCQRWDVTVPHKPKHIPEDGGHHNYCRNPDKDSMGTWCYTTEPTRRWEYCTIPKCDSVYAVWTSYDDRDRTAFFQYVKADPELMIQNDTSDTGLYRKDFENARFAALAVDRYGEEIFFTDIVNNYLGVFNTKTLEVKRYLEGEAADIYAIAQDPVTGNVYWTDLKTKSVMVADKEFRAVVTIYNTAPYEPRAITVLPSERKVVFSTYAKVNDIVHDAVIEMVDMSGGSRRILYQSPDVVNVTGLDADEQRIYWTDNLVDGSKIMSCRFDGSDLTEHYYKKFGSFKDIAVYSEYIYVTDSRVRYNYFDHIRYHVEVVEKSSGKVFTYTKPDQPHGIAILDKEVSSETDNFLEQCQSRCGGVCLSDFRGEYTCRCTFGHLLNRVTGDCTPIQAKFEGGELIKVKKSQH